MKTVAVHVAPVRWLILMRCSSKYHSTQYSKVSFTQPESFAFHFTWPFDKMYVSILPQRFVWCIVILCDGNTVKMDIQFPRSRMAVSSLPSVNFQLFLLQITVFYFVLCVPLVLHSRCSINILLNCIFPALVCSNLLMLNLYRHFSGHLSEKLEYK